MKYYKAYSSIDCNHSFTKSIPVPSIKIKTNNFKKQYQQIKLDSLRFKYIEINLNY